jgi:ABC-type phosphate/phosphonate transport system substrate-binding protein
MKISCGMYAFTSDMRDAWAVIFENLHYYLPRPYNRPFILEFDTTSLESLHQNLFLGHTCGYPYVTRWYKSHEPVCVPEFEVPGCDGVRYSSVFVTRADSEKSSPDEFRNSIAAINTRDSNSGMNVLRHEIAQYAQGAPYFNTVVISESHLESMNMVIQGKADIAAIDSVTYHFAVGQDLLDASKLKIIGRSRHTTGLPFVISRNIKFDREIIVDAMNSCLENIPDVHKSFLKIRRFSRVEANDYESIKQLESESRKLGYSKLQ